MSKASPLSRLPKAKVPADVWVTAAVVVGVLAGFFGLVWYPAHRQHTQFESRASGAVTRLSDIGVSEAELARLQEEVAALRTQIGNDPHVVPESPQLSSLLRSLTESARSQGVQDQELTTRDFQRFADFAVIPTNLEFEAGFASALAVVEAIENHRRLTGVERTELRGDNDAIGRRGLQTRLELAAYFTGDGEARP